MFMHNIVQNLDLVKNKVNEIIQKKQLKTFPKIIAVSKTFSTNKIIPLLDAGHVHFGENKVQEAENKWPGIKEKYKNVQLHMLGKLQANKAKKAVKLFDYIHSLDNEKLASKISYYEKELNKKIKIFIQINVGNENQKSGILINDLKKFYSYCINDLALNIVGLMCIPPINSDNSKYFKILKIKTQEFNLLELSIGMSSDYPQAIQYGATYLRLGTAIFGGRNN